MGIKESFRIFFEFPVRNFTFFARLNRPFVSQPSGRSGISGVLDLKGLSAMRRYNRIISVLFNFTDSVQNALTGWPQFHFIEQNEQLYVFSVISFFTVGHMYCLSEKKWRGAREFHPAV